MSIPDELYSLVRAFALKKAKRISQGPVPEIPDARKIALGDGKGGFTVGVATRDITPKDYRKRPYWMAGYRIGKRITDLLDPLTASAMWIGCGANDGIVLISCDLIGMTGYEIRQIREELASFCKIARCRHVTVSCTHTHAGVDTMGYWGPLPKSGRDEKYMRFLKNTISELCVEAYRSRKPGAMYYGNIDAPELAHRWRKPDFTKAQLHRFRFVPDDGGREVWYLNFPAHPNTLGGNNRMMSADYPCYMRNEIRRRQDVDILYSVSAIGATDIGEFGNNDVEKTILGGMKLGEKAFEIVNERKLDASVAVVSQEFVMPLDNPVLSLANSLGVFHARACAADSLTGTGFISEVTYLEIGGVHILTMPGEMFPELVWSGGYEGADTSSTGESADVDPTSLCEIFDDPDIIVFGVTNDMAGYAIARNDFVLDGRMPYLNRATDRFGRSHYHETNSCGIDTGDTIADTCKRIKRILEEDNA